MKKILLAISVAAFLAVVPLTDGGPCPEDNGDIFCETECTSGGWGLACFDASTRCCFEGPSSCGDMHAEDCGPFCSSCEGEGGF